MARSTLRSLVAMDSFAGRTAVVTGAASGIGRALVDRCLAEGMNVMLADVEAAALDATLASLAAAGQRVAGSVVGVAKADDVDRLAAEAAARFGPVHLLFNNAGVGAGTTAWESTLAEWTWVMGVNVWGVIHGIRSFVPGMLAHGEPGCVVNTASTAGLGKGHRSAPYATTKHAVVALTEQLSVEFARTGARLRAAALCPSWVDTRLDTAARNRPPGLQDAAGTAPAAWRWERIAESTVNATPPSRIADFTFAGLRAGRLYLLPHPESQAWIQRRFDGILADF
jgi:NAD(P)-dependent dehydrogenase (short-subunit alcohol dehydrogenase family)